MRAEESDANFEQSDAFVNNEEALDQPHAFIHIPHKNTSNKYERRIVPVERLRKLNYNDFIANPSSFSSVMFKYKDDEGNKIKCFVLYAAGKIIINCIYYVNFNYYIFIFPYSKYFQQVRINCSIIKENSYTQSTR